MKKIIPLNPVTRNYTPLVVLIFAGFWGTIGVWAWVHYHPTIPAEKVIPSCDYLCHVQPKPIIKNVRDARDHFRHPNSANAKRIKREIEAQRAELDRELVK